MNVLNEKNIEVAMSAYDKISTLPNKLNESQIAYREFKGCKQNALQLSTSSPKIKWVMPERPHQLIQENEGIENPFQLKNGKASNKDNIN